MMRHENPYESVASLRALAALEPTAMLTGHGRRIDDPAPRLRLKAERVQEAAFRAVELHRRGLPVAEVVRRIFARHGARDRVLAVMTSFEFSRANFVRAAIALEPR